MRVKVRIDSSIGPVQCVEFFDGLSRQIMSVTALPYLMPFFRDPNKKPVSLSSPRCLVVPSLPEPHPTTMKSLFSKKCCLPFERAWFWERDNISEDLHWTVCCAECHKRLVWLLKSAHICQHYQSWHAFQLGGIQINMICSEYLLSLYAFVRTHWSRSVITVFQHQSWVLFDLMQQSTALIWH